MVAGEDFEAGIRDGAGDQAGVLLLYHILAACNHKRRALDAGEFIGPHIGIVHHQPQHFGTLQGLRVLAREESGDAVSDFDGQLRGEFHPRGVQISAVQDEPLHPLGVGECEHHRYVAAVGEAEDMGLTDVVHIHEGEQVFRKLTDGERGRAARRLPVPPGIYRHYAEMLREGLRLVHKIARILPVPMQQNQRKSLSQLYMMMRNLHSHNQAE